MAAAVVALGFLITLEIASRHYGMPGPITNQAQEVVLAPKTGPLLYAGMALMTVVLTWRPTVRLGGCRDRGEGGASGVPQGKEFSLGGGGSRWTGEVAVGEVVAGLMVMRPSLRLDEVEGVGAESDDAAGPGQSMVVFGRPMPDPA